MKKTDLEKQKGLKINNRINNLGGSQIFKSNEKVIDKKEQRRLDQSLGLLPFAVKIHEDLIAEIHAITDKRKISLNECVADLLRKGIDAGSAKGK